ncbi:MAG: protein kinase domain-containing protein [Planctomycetota bacterium]
MSNSLHHSVKDSLDLAVSQTMTSMGFESVRAARVSSVSNSSLPVAWSWIKLLEPTTGLFVMLQPIELGARIACSMTGCDLLDLDDPDILDSFAECTNVLAGTFLRSLLGAEVTPGLSLPRTGRGAPSVRSGEWIGNLYHIDDLWAAIFISGDALLHFDRNAHQRIQRRPTEQLAGATAASTTSHPGISPLARPPSGRLGDEERSRAIKLDEVLEALPQTVQQAPDGRQAALDGDAEPDVDDRSQLETEPVSRKPDTAAAPGAPARVQSSAGAGAGGYSRRLDLPPQLGNYSIVKEIGIGGMAGVYLAEQQPLGRQVALKVLFPALRENESFARRFVREARLAASVEHPNVVTIYDAGEAEDLLYLAMQYIPGGDLGRVIEKRGTLSEIECCEIAIDCLRGLEAIAAAGMVHRDIKPGNILLGFDAIPKITDLGLARPQLDEEQLSMPGVPMGTPAYMSPEQADCCDDPDIRCDIYALGVTMFVMLAGENPFAGRSLVEVLRNIVTKPTPAIAAHNTTTTTGMQRILKKAMAKDRAARYENPTVFREAVESHLERLQNDNLKRNSWIGRLFHK